MGREAKTMECHRGPLKQVETGGGKRVRSLTVRPRGSGIQARSPGGQAGRKVHGARTCGERVVEL